MEKTQPSPIRRCPYPDCPAHQHGQSPAHQHGQSPAGDGTWHVADLVFLCLECGRLAYQCITPTCCELNRPFSYCCRKCGKCQFLRAAAQVAQTAASRWQLAQQFDPDWRFQVENGGNAESHARHRAEPVSAATVATLDENKATTIVPSRSTEQSIDNPVLLECRFLDGLLAIHRGGEYLKLLHPFADIVKKDQASPVLWSESEGRLLDKAGCRLPQVHYQPDWFRPYPPAMTQDRRFAIFATPYLCAVLDLWTLPGWSAIQQPRCELLFAFDEKSSVRLAAAPVPLTVQPWPYNQIGEVDLRRDLQPNQVGLLLRHTNDSYWWCNVRLEQFFGDGGANARAELAECVRLAIRSQFGDIGADSADEELKADRERTLPWCVRIPIEGESVQVNWFQDQCLIFATPAGHWLWSRADACAGRVVVSLDNPTAGQDSTTQDGESAGIHGSDNAFSGVNDSDENDGGLWSLPSGSSKPVELDNQIADRKNFSWQKQCLFSSSSSTVNRFEIAYTVDKCAKTRTVLISQRRQTENSRPVESLKSCRGLLSWSAPDSLQHELLFVSGNDGTIHKRINTQHEPIRLQNMQIGDVNEVGGLQFLDPLMILVRDDPSSQNFFEVRLRTLRHPSDVAVVSGIELQADPVAWSNFLFTCETEGGSVCLKRREFCVISNGTNMHVSGRKPLGPQTHQ